MTTDTKTPKDANITKFPGRTRKPPVDDDRFLVVDPGLGCQHSAGFIVNRAEAYVTCRDCKTKLNPIHVLHQMMTSETSWHRTRALYQEEMKRLKERSRTCCEHCGRMTTISKN